MSENNWICIEMNGKKYLRPTNHANCESVFHAVYERIAKEKMFVVSDEHIVGNTYNVDNYIENENINEPRKQISNIDTISDAKFIRGNNFIIDIGDFEKLSREVGYYNAKSNIKNLDGEYDESAISKYEDLRSKQLDMLAELIKFYSH